MKRQRGNEGEIYINSFPKLKKWINEWFMLSRERL